MSIHTDTTTTITIKQAIDGFLLSCKVEGKPYGTIECYTDKLKGFLRQPPEPQPYVSAPSKYRPKTLSCVPLNVTQ